MTRIKLLGILDIKTGKDLALFIFSALFWLIALEKITNFFTIVNTAGKFTVYVIGVFLTWLLLKGVVK